MNREQEPRQSSATDRQTEVLVSEDPETESSVLPFPVVCVGSSAGGLEALEEFFRHMPADSGMAFVVIQHLSPEHQSALAEILTRYATMPVEQITDGIGVEPNHVYVIAPGFTLTLEEGRLRLGEPIEKRGHRRPVDDFLRSLAEEQKKKSIAIILSGTGTDGTAGAQAIKAAGGICIAQNPDSAAFPGMPRSLIHAGYADQVLQPRDMPAVLQRYISNPYLGEEPEALQAERELERDTAHLREILAILRTRTRHDFSGYRKPTLLRRIQRRMSLIALTQLTDYAAVLREDAGEVASLANDLMINVTGFFRDPDAWEALRTAVIGPLCASRLNGEPIRAWVTACASGEEAYSLAILIAEEARARGVERPEVKIFATDTADKSLALARAGVFPGGIEADMSPERLDRFFDRDDHTYRVKKEIRDMVVFAPQDLLRDPPFSRVDLCTCRNLLIYLEPETQRRVISLLHFALRDGGYMFLGTTETFGGSEHLFEVISKKWRIYRRTGLAQQRFSDVPNFALRAQEASGPLHEMSSNTTRPSATLLLQRALLERYGPPTVVVDRNDQVVYFHGLTDPFLQHPAGEPTRDIIQLVKPWLRLSVRTALRNAMRENRTFTTECEVGQDAGTPRTLRVTSEPVLQGRSPEYFLVSFQFLSSDIERANDDWRTGNALAREDSQVDGTVFDEVQTLRRELQNTIEAFEATSEELKASNEEATSINEELQSTNEELETGKEELQSVNEELTTVNSQLQTKISQLEATTNDLANLLGSTDIGVVFLDADFRVRRFTAAVSDLLELIDSDIGRPITDLAPKFTDDHLLQDAREVLLRLIPIERVIRSHSNRWYLRRTLPYRTAENRIEGVVITFVDVGARKGTEQEIMNAHLRVKDMLERLPMSIVIIEATDGGGVLFANDRARELFGGTLASTPSGGRVSMPRFQAAKRDGEQLQAEEWPLTRALNSGTTVTDQIRLGSAAGKKLLHVTAAPVSDGNNAIAAVVGIFSEISAEGEASAEAAAKARQSNS